MGGAAKAARAKGQPRGKDRSCSREQRSGPFWASRHRSRKIGLTTKRRCPSRRFLPACASWPRASARVREEAACFSSAGKAAQTWAWCRDETIRCQAETGHGRRLPCIKTRIILLCLGAFHVLQRPSNDRLTVACGDLEAPCDTRVRPCAAFELRLSCPAPSRCDGCGNTSSRRSAENSDRLYKAAVSCEP